MLSPADTKATEEMTVGGSVYYIREPNGALVARVAGGSAHYYHFDALGSTRLLTDADGAVTDTYTYDAWGKVTGRTGTTAQPYQYVGQLGYCTHVHDDNMDLLQLGVRFYDPETGRFTQVDAVPVSRISDYAYVYDRPTYLTDPSGRIPHAGTAVCWLASCWDCDKDAQADAGGETDAYCKTHPKRCKGLLGPSNGHDENNAFGHCVRACHMMRKCRWRCPRTAFYLNDIYEFGWWLPWTERGRESRMDIHNNNIGIGCAEGSKSCVECCLEHQGDWDKGW